MQLKINNKTFTEYSSAMVSLAYDAIASAFSFDVDFNPADANDRSTFVPGNYNLCEISHNGEQLITGVLISQSFRSSSVAHLLKIGGYSKTGVLQDCQKPAPDQSQFTGMSLTDITRKLIAPFGLNLIVDAYVRADADKPYTTSPIIEPDDTILKMITQLALGRNIIFSHDSAGNLLFTRANADAEPIYSFNGSYPATAMELTFNGEGMHNTISAVGQMNFDTDNSSIDRNATTNPYVQSKTQLSGVSTTLGLPAIAYETGYRPGVYLQRTGNDNTTPLTTRQFLSQELKNIRLTIELQGWTLNDRLVKPNSIITVVNPDLFLYQKSRWFIERVDYRYNNPAETAILHCVLPECFTTGGVQNIFTGSNLTVPYSETGRKIIITPFVNDSVI